MEQSLAIVLADVDVLTVEYVSDLLERHGFRVRIAPPVHAAVGDWILRYGADLCLLDIALRDGADVAGIAWLHQEYPETKIVIRTASTSPDTMRAALDAGASGYVHKSRGPVTLLEAIRRVLDGEVVVEGSFARPVSTRADEHGDVIRLVGSLTPRQYECLELLMEGKSTVAIANHLGVSVMTVRSHIQAVLGKLGVRSRLEAASLMTKLHAAMPVREGTLHSMADGGLSA
jgi:two-component system nitrate/nitrite response regulator NarL